MSSPANSVYFIWFQSLNFKLHLFETSFQSTFWHHLLSASAMRGKKMVRYTTLPSQTTLWEHCIGRNALCCANYVPTALSGPVSSIYLWVPTPGTEGAVWNRVSAGGCGPLVWWKITAIKRCNASPSAQRHIVCHSS